MADAYPEKATSAGDLRSDDDNKNLETERKHSDAAAEAKRAERKHSDADLDAAVEAALMLERERSDAAAKVAVEAAVKAALRLERERHLLTNVEEVTIPGKLVIHNNTPEYIFLIRLLKLLMFNRSFHKRRFFRSDE